MRIGSGHEGLAFAKPTPKWLAKEQKDAEREKKERKMLDHVRKRDPVCRCCGGKSMDPHHDKRRSLNPWIVSWDVRQIFRVCRRCHNKIQARMITVICRNAEAPQGVTFTKAQ